MGRFGGAKKIDANENQRPARTLTGFRKIWRSAKAAQDSATKTRIPLI
jgi:hypothetical protein